jgi:methylenetetrahydrofolate dehydrogenase (NADP+)/methenyltetrahydrofolate cyclohydrolase
MLNIKVLSETIRDEVREEAKRLENSGITPRMSVILVGGDESAKIYANTKQKVASKLGIHVDIDTFPESITQDEIERYISRISVDKRIHGILLESPFPRWLNYDSALAMVNPNKDIDGLHEVNQGKLLNGNLDSALLPATPLACIAILEQLVESIVWKNIVVIWRWRTVWKPLANLLIQKWATVTVANSKTQNLKGLCLRADVIISATWQINTVTSDMIHPESIVIDAWISVDSSGNVIGDVDTVNVSKIARFVTPVPWGVWLITTSIIFKNLLKAISLQGKEDHFGLSLSQFIELASWPNMPGGGWISAVVWSLAISMAAMVVSLTKTWELDPKIREDLQDDLQKMKDLYYADISAFDEYLLAIRLPKGTDWEKDLRSNEIQKSLQHLCEVPLQFWEVIIQILSQVTICAQCGNKNVISDVSVSVHLLMAALKSSLEGISLNIRSIKNTTYIGEVQKRQEMIYLKAQELEKNILTITSNR